MTRGLKNGDCVVVTKIGSDMEENDLQIGDRGVVISPPGTHPSYAAVHGMYGETVLVRWDDPEKSDWWTFPKYLEKERKVMGTTVKDRTTSPNHFRNGDVIRCGFLRNDMRVFIKFGSNFYELTGSGDHLKGHKYLPRGRRDVILNIGGMGEFFLMTMDELKKQIK